jgi:hypothetical protein
MGSTITVADTEAAIWNRLIRPDLGDLPLVARFFLGIRFDVGDLNRMHELAVKNQEVALSAEEEAQLRAYRRVGLQLDLIRAKARLWLQQNPNGQLPNQ